MTTVFVSGAVANKHRHGGSIWVRMSWAEALRDAGFDVLFVEQIESPTAEQIAVFDAVMEEFGFGGSAALICDGAVHGMGREELLARAEEAALLVNISGHLRWEPLLRRLRRRTFVDLDPGFTQIWHAEGRDVGVAAHDLHFTVGTNVGTPRCPLPVGDVRWRPVRQPVSLARWSAAPGTDGAGGFSTVASWRGAFGPPQWAGRTYGVKAHEFRRFLPLAASVDAEFRVALEIHPGDSDDASRLTSGGWRLVDPAVVATTRGFHDFVQSSGAEFSPAQGVYVETNSGWFSDRTVRYLASGRPALVQDTGFDLPTGEGLISFRTLDEAVAGAEELRANYVRHRRAARRIAEEHFAGERTIGPMLEDAGVAP